MLIDAGANKPHPQKIIYIVSSKLSGSTLLDLMLDRHSLVESLGEIISLDRWLTQNWLCSCSRPLADCDYWKEILKAARHSANQEVVGTIPDSRRRLWRYWWPDKETARRYGQRSLDLFGAVWHVTGRPVIVDSSKSLPRLKLLHLSGMFDLRVVHLIRDGRGHLHSQLRKRPPPVAKNLRNKKHGRARTVLSWVVYNRLIARTLRQMPDVKWLRIRYEDLAADPESKLTEICRFADLWFEPKMTVPTTLGIHNIAGNQWRFDSKAEIPIVLDENWRTGLSTSDALIFELLAGRYNRSLGYYH